MKKLFVSILVMVVLISNTTLGVAAKSPQQDVNGKKLSTTTSEITYLPDTLLVDDPENPSQALEAFLNTCSDTKVVFPSNKTFVLERQFVIHGVSNLEIDFNGCIIQLPNDCAWPKRYDTGEYVPLSAITVHNSSNITFSNYIIDGNSSNISVYNWCTGLWLVNTNGFSSNNGSLINCNYHHIVIYGGTKNITFTGTYFKDHGGAITSAGEKAGISDVFVRNNSDDNFSFIDTTIDNIELKDGQGQGFYIAGYNGLIDTVYANNCSVPLDVRKGTHIARNFTVNNAKVVLMVQPNSNNSTEFADLTASNFTGTNITGGDGASGVYIIGCDKCHLDNFKIEMDPTSEYSWYGIRVRKYFENYPLNDVVIKNAEASNFKNTGILLQNLTNSVSLQDITLTDASSTIYGIKSMSCTVEQYVESLTVVNCKSCNSTDNMIVLK